MNDHVTHPALVGHGGQLVCADPRCATLLPPDAEICDECAGTRLERLDRLRAILCGWADDRPVVFKLEPGRTAVIGRSTPDGPPPEVDLERVSGSRSVHRQHASIEGDGGVWRVTHLGTNPLTILGAQRLTLGPGASAEVRHGDTLDVSGIRLTLVLRESRPSI